jgi:lipopolysaccharide/colanic/teichoic acid biosynthesis glycosyltransferase
MIGNMSLVGPRPEVPKYVAVYPPAIRDKVLSVRPGITDPAAVKFFAEAELLAQSSDPERYYVDVILPQKLDLYVKYIESRTFLSDLRVLAETILTIGARRRDQ